MKSSRLAILVIIGLVMAGLTFTQCNNQLRPFKKEVKARKKNATTEACSAKKQELNNEKLIALGKGEKSIEAIENEIISKKELESEERLRKVLKHLYADDLYKNEKNGFNSMTVLQTYITGTYNADLTEWEQEKLFLKAIANETFVFTGYLEVSTNLNEKELILHSNCPNDKDAVDLENDCGTIYLCDFTPFNELYWFEQLSLPRSSNEKGMGELREFINRYSGDIFNPNAGTKLICTELPTEPEAESIRRVYDTWRRVINPCCERVLITTKVDVMVRFNEDGHVVKWWALQL